MSPTPPPGPPDIDAGRLADAMRRVLEAGTGRGVRLVETHISWVLLDGEFAWKIKKPVRLGFLDFGELATRKRYCEEELRLNRRLAPALYLEVVAIRGSPDAPRLEGTGDAIEYAVKMRQFPPGSLLSERLAAGRLDAAQLDRLAARLVAFHDAAPAAGADGDYGSGARIEADTAHVLDGLAHRVGSA
jgi:aminoglycoside phosphotransferase family enzyme